MNRISPDQLCNSKTINALDEIIITPSLNDDSQIIKNPVQFLGFSDEDARLMEFREANICYLNGNPTKDFIDRPFFIKIPKGHSIYRAISQLANDPQKTRKASFSNGEFKVAELINYLREYSKKVDSETSSKGIFINWPNPISDASIIGSLLWWLLLKERNLLRQAIKEYFSPYISEKSLEQLLSELDLGENQQDILNPCEDKLNEEDNIEADISITCKGDANYRFRLSELSKQYFLDKFPHAEHNIHKYDIINHQTALIAFNLAKRSYEFIFSEESKNCSTDTCLYVSILPILDDSEEDLEIVCKNFSPGKVLIDFCCKIYTPSDLTNPEVWIRYLLDNECIVIGDHEKLMVENIIAPFYSKINHEGFVRILNKYKYKPKQIEELTSKSSFINNFQEKAIALYIYSLLKRKIRSKKKEPFNKYTDKEFAEFIFRVCHSLHTYRPQSDLVIAQILDWVMLDKLISFQQAIRMYPNGFIDFGNATSIELFYFALIYQKFPFSVLSDILTLHRWNKDPKQYTFRQNPGIFFGKQPFIIRAKINPVPALQNIRLYLNTAISDPGMMRCIYEHLGSLRSDGCHALLISSLKIKEADLINEIIPLLEHQDPFICSLAIEIGLTVPSWSDPTLFLKQLPKLFIEYPPSPEILTKLCKKSTLHFNIYPQEIPSLNTPRNVLRLLLLTSEPSLICLALSWWKENKDAFSLNIGLKVLNGFAKIDPDSAAFHLQSTLSEHSPINPRKLELFLQAFIKISHLFHHKKIKQNPKHLCSSLELLLHHALRFKDKKQLETFKNSLAFILEPAFSFVQPSSQYHLLSFKAALNGYMRMKNLPNNLYNLVKPLKIYFGGKIDKEGKLNFPQNETNHLLHILTESLNGKNLPNPIVAAWMDITTWIFYLSNYPESDLTIPKPIDSLKQYYGHLKQENLSIIHLKTIFDDIIKNFEDGQLELLTAFKINELKVKKEWLKLLSQTQEPALIEMANEIWNENKETLPAKTDLLIFEALCQTDPRKALDYLLNRENILEINDLISAINAIRYSFQKKGHTNGYEMIFPLFDNLLKLQEIPFKNKEQKSSFLKSLRSFIDHQQDLALKNNTELMNNATLYLLKNKDEKALEILDQLPPEEISPNIKELYSVFLLEWILISLNRSPYNDLNYKRTKKIIDLSPDLRLVYLSKIFDSISLNPANLSYHLAKVIEVNLPHELPSLIRRYLDVKRGQLIEPFEIDQKWEIVQIYLRAFKTYRIHLNNFELRAWTACQGLLFDEKATEKQIFELLQILEPKSWVDHFKGSDLAAIDSLLQRLTSEDQALESQMFPYLAAFILYYLLHSNEKPLQNCSDAVWLNLVESIIPLNCEIKLAEYLLLNRESHAETMVKMGYFALDAHFKNNPINCDYSFKLIKRYFPNDIAFWSKLWKAIVVAKPKNLNEYLDFFERSSFESSLQLTECWMEIFDYLLLINHENIWIYIETLPSFFNESQMEEMKNCAKIKLIKGTATLLLNKNSKSPLVKEKKDSVKNTILHDQRSAIILSSALSCPNISLEAFLLTFSTLSELQMLSKLTELLDLTVALVKANQDADRLDKADSFRHSYNQNFFLLMMLASKKPSFKNIENATHCLKYGRHIFRLTAEQMKQITEKIFPSSITNLKKYNPTYFIDYIFFEKMEPVNSESSESFAEKLIVIENSNIDENVYHLSTTIKNIWRCHQKYFHNHQIFAPHCENPSLMKESLENTLFSIDAIYFISRDGLKEEFEHKHYLKVNSINLLYEGLSAIWNLDLNKVPSEYLMWIFSYLHTLPRDPEYLQRLKAVIVIRLIEKIEMDLKRKIPMENVRRIIEAGIEYETKKIYEYYAKNLPEDNIKKSAFHISSELLLKALKANIFQKDSEWLFIYLHLLSPLKDIQTDNNIQTDPVFPNKPLVAYQKVLNLLLSYDTPFSYYSSFRKFAVHIGSSQLISEKKRMEWFEKLIEGSLKFRFSTINNMTLLGSLNESCFHAESEQEISQYVKAGSEFNKYLIKMIELEMRACHQCILEVPNDNDSWQWKAHFYWLYLDLIHFKFLYHGYDDDFLTYFEELDRLMSGIIEIEFFHFFHEISKKESIFIPKLSDLTISYSGMINENFYFKGQEEKILECKEKQFSLMIKWFDTLMNLPMEDKPELSDKKNDLVLAALFEIISAPVFDYSIEKSKNKFEEIKKWLLERNLNDTHEYFLDMIDFYYVKDYEMNPEYYAKTYKEFCYKYLSLPNKNYRWKSLFKILKWKAKVFKEKSHLIEYKNAYCTFLDLVFQISKGTVSNSESDNNLRLKRLSIMESIDFGIDHKLIVTGHRESYEHYELMKKNIKEADQYFNIPFELNDLILKAGEKPEEIDVFKHEILNLMPHLIFWSRQNKRNDRMDSFTNLFNYFPENDQTHLIKSWEESLNTQILRIINI
jgi:hypothetical protein